MSLSRFYTVSFESLVMIELLNCFSSRLSTIEANILLMTVNLFHKIHIYFNK